MNILDDLSAPQKEAVTHIKGPLLIIAGAGSGKTRVVTRRIAYLIESGISPWNILAITFTNKAAGEMLERTRQLVDSKHLWISTFHSFCARILRRYAASLGFTERFSIFDTLDTFKAVKDVMAALNLDTTHWKPDGIAQTISLHKNKLISPQEARTASAGYYFEVASNVYERYQKYLFENNAMDFDDLLVNMVKLIREYPDILSELQERFEYILIDEYQDTNHAQYLIAKLLADKNRNICATGDPDQSIYGWRGADINNILDFEKDYPNCTTIKLEQNYRSSKRILRAASSVVKRNVKRKEKRLWTNNEDGELLRLFKVHDEEDEASAVADEIRNLRDEKGLSLNQIAVFFRINALSRAFEMAFIRQGIPYVLVAGVEFFSRKEIKDVLAYLRMALNLKDNVSFKRIINTPPRGIGVKTVERIAEYAAGKGLSLAEASFGVDKIESIPAAAKAKIKVFNETLLEIMDAPSSPVKDVVEKVLEKSRYLDYLSNSARQRSDEQLENVMELVNAATVYDELHKDGSLEGFLEEASLTSDIDKWDRNADAVSLMTLHAAKGLEFDTVFLIGFEENILPYSRSDDEFTDVEEERRLCHVGMTRAKKRLYISMCNYRMRYGRSTLQMPSRFFNEIPQELIKTEKAIVEEPFDSSEKENEHRDIGFDVGDLVRSPYFGLGRVVSVSGSGPMARVRVDFNTGGQKNLVLAYANLQKSQIKY